MRLLLAALFAFCTAIAPLSWPAQSQDAPKAATEKSATEKAAPAKSADDKAPKAAATKPAPKAAAKSVLLCPQQKGGDKVNVTCGDGEKCCYHPLFDNGSCVPQAEGCMGIVNPLPRVSR